jgi:hypothetical protein
VTVVKERAFKKKLRLNEGLAIVVHAIIQATQEVKIGGSSPRLAWAKA